MKKLLLNLSFIITALAVNAQVAVTDSAVLGAGYATDVYYSMANGTVSATAGNNWHLAFSTRNAAPPANVLRSATILVNEGRGSRVYESNQSDWATFDSTGYTTWANPHNSDTSWDIGAFNANRTLANPFDFGWGAYNMTNHNVEGTDKIYLLKTDSGFRKLLINVLAFDTQWVFTIAKLDGSDSNTVVIKKGDFTGKLFAYYNANQNITIDREPAAAWDVVFTRYSTNVTQFGQTIFSNTTGVLSYPGLMTSSSDGLPKDSLKPGVYNTRINTIGTDWKFNPGERGPGFVAKDSLAYFVKLSSGVEYKLTFTSFSGSPRGSIVFAKTELETPTGLFNAELPGKLRIFPNPASGNVTVEFPEMRGAYTVNIFDITGKMVQSVNATSSNASIDISSLNKGLYFVSIESNGAKKAARLIVE